MKLVFASLVVAYVFVLNEADPSECFYCTLRDATKCNTPINRELIGHQSCSEIDTNKNTTSRTVCYHVTAIYKEAPISERGCYYAEMEGEDLCSYFNRTEANVPFTSDFACKLCNTTNCNDD